KQLPCRAAAIVRAALESLEMRPKPRGELPVELLQGPSGEVVRPQQVNPRRRGPPRQITPAYRASRPWRLVRHEEYRIRTRFDPERRPPPFFDHRTFP